MGSMELVWGSGFGQTQSLQTIEVFQGLGFRAEVNVAVLQHGTMVQNAVLQRETMVQNAVLQRETMIQNAVLQRGTMVQNLLPVDRLWSRSPQTLNPKTPNVRRPSLLSHLAR